MNRPEMKQPAYRMRRATAADSPAMAEAHRDSIQTLCGPFYAPEVIAEWIAPINRERYHELFAHDRDVCAFVAQAEGGRIVGFSESHRVVDGEFSIAVYVAGSAARQGVGSALYRAAEAYAREAGAECIVLNASLAAVEFYEKNGLTRMQHTFSKTASGRKLAVVRMQKLLQQPQAHSRSESKNNVGA